MHDSLSLRKAAVLLASLDPPTADSLLRQMDADHADRLRAALVALGEVDPLEQEQVAGEFFDNCPSGWDAPDGGVELDQQLAQRLAQPICENQTAVPGNDPAADKNAEFRPGACPSGSGPALIFQFLQEPQAANLVELLKTEQPQTIAVVVSQLSADRAAKAIAGLPAAVQSDVLRRLIDLDPADPHVIREVERSLEQRLEAHTNQVERRAAGVSLVHNILAAADRNTSQAIRRNVARHDTPLAQWLGQTPLAFADLAVLDDASLWRVFSAADPDWVVLAVAGAQPELADRVIKLLPPEEAADFCQALNHLGPTPLSDIEEAQRRIAQLAGQLEFEGVLKIPPWRLGTVAV